MLKFHRHAQEIPLNESPKGNAFKSTEKASPCIVILTSEHTSCVLIVSATFTSKLKVESIDNYKTEIIAASKKL